MIGHEDRQVKNEDSVVRGWCLKPRGDLDPRQCDSERGFFLLDQKLEVPVSLWLSVACMLC